MSDFLYDHTGRKFLKCAQLMDEATFGAMVETPAEAHAGPQATVAPYELAQPTSKGAGKSPVDKLAAAAAAVVKGN